MNYASLNIMFLTACKLCKFLANVPASLNNFHVVLIFTIACDCGARLSELNVIAQGRGATLFVAERPLERRVGLLVMIKYVTSVLNMLLNIWGIPRW